MTIQLRELTIGESLGLASRPPHLEQTNVTAFLRAAVTDADKNDPRLWRVGERILAIAHYLACVTDDPDYKIGDGRYSDYLVPEEAEIPDRVDLGELVGEPWSMRHLTGRLAESIERLEMESVTGHGLWRIGMMAAQMYRADEADPDAMTDGALDEWLQARAQSFLTLPESEFEAMLLGFSRGQRALTHLFRLSADNSGLICPAAREDSGLAPARFPVVACLGSWAQAMARQPD
jgi:hypothetical protein